MQINIEKNREEYSNEAERGTERGMRYLYTLTASKIHLLLERDFVVVYGKANNKVAIGWRNSKRKMKGIK